jgi:hypothetical protein
MKPMHMFVASLMFSLLLGAPARAQIEPGDRIQQLEQRVAEVERDLSHRLRDGAGIAIFLFGAFCALWAQNTGRSSLLWFFLGLFFHVFAVLVLLYKNPQRPPAANTEATRP